VDLNLLAAAIFSWTSLESWFAIFQMAAGLGFVIFVHELGHFLVAKSCGVKCEKFYVGFDAFDIKIGDTVIIPRTLIKKRWGETEYGLGILPLGGYVKMLGQDDNPAKAAEERERSLIKKEDAETADETAFELDPRSYQAKTVWQRMAIISAGVIMNLIFAVIFAAIAYGIGVDYQPTIIGGTVPGGPAWERNLRPGDEVVAFGANGQERPHMRFRDDFLSAVVYNGDKRDLTLKIKPYGTDSRELVNVRPRVDVVKQKASSVALIGVVSAQTLTLSDTDPTVVNTSAHAASKDGKGFLPRDHILKVAVVKDGQVVHEQDLPDVQKLQEYLARHNTEVVRFTVRRAVDKESEQDPASGEVVSFDVDPNPLKTVGLAMKFGPIVALQDGSPAVKAGLQVGDQLLNINGEPVGDPLTLSQRLRKFAGDQQLLTVSFARGDETREVQIQPRLPYTSNFYSQNLDQRIAIDELGISFVVTNEVAFVVPGSSADEQGMQAGDLITKVEFVAADEEKRKFEAEKLGFRGEAQNHFDFSEVSNAWPLILTESIQHRLPDTKIIVEYQRGSGTELKKQQANLVATDSTDTFLDSRGIRYSPATEMHRASSIKEAFSLGYRQTKEDATKIYGLLYKLLNGEVSPLNLGGPGTIAKAATHEALSGPAHILLFLTLLSANLAIVNFLPIPVLDGGHMVFLIYEAIFRKPISEKLQVIFSVMGLIFIVGLMLMVISLDIWREFV
jgi:regulator of sigma E protease